MTGIKHIPYYSADGNEIQEGFYYYTPPKGAVRVGLVSVSNEGCSPKQFHIDYLGYAGEHLTPKRASELIGLLRDEDVRTEIKYRKKMLEEFEFKAHRYFAERRNSRIPKPKTKRRDADLRALYSIVASTPAFTHPSCLFRR